jgi:hypothetical protein
VSNLDTLSMLNDVLGEVRAIQECLHDIHKALGQMSEARSSVQVNTSTRGTDCTVKVYAGSPVGEVINEARDEYARLIRDIVQLQMNNWEATVKPEAA